MAINGAEERDGHEDRSRERISRFSPSSSIGHDGLQASNYPPTWACGDKVEALASYDVADYLRPSPVLPRMICRIEAPSPPADRPICLLSALIALAMEPFGVYQGLGTNDFAAQRLPHLAHTDICEPRQTACKRANDPGV